MKLYYTFGVCESRDYEFTITDEVIANYLTKITDFSIDDIIQHFDLFTDIFKPQIYEHFKVKAKLEFEKTIDLQDKSIVLYLRQKEINKRVRQAFIKREQMKKMIREKI